MVIESNSPKAPIPVLIAMIVRNKELLLTRYKGPTGEDSWNPPNFYLRFGEDPSNQLKKEILTKLHLLTEVLELLQAAPRVATSPETGHSLGQILLFYRVKPIRGVNLLKSQDITWTSLDRIENYGVVYPTRAVFSHLLKV